MLNALKGIPIGAMFVVVALTGCNDSSNQTIKPVTQTQQSTTTQQPAQQPAPQAEKKKWSWLNDAQAAPYTSTDNLLRKNYLVVFDGSGSMSGERIRIAKKAAKAFTQKVTNDDLLGLVAFDNTGTSVRVPLKANNKANFSAQIDQIVDGGGTPLNSAIFEAYKIVREQGARQRGYGEYHIIVITDGEANSGEDPRNLVQEIVKFSPVNIHTIGFQFSGSHSLNQAGITSYYQADNYDELMKSFSSILAESTSFDDVNFN